MYQSDGQCEPGKEVSEAMRERYTDISIKVSNKADLFIYLLLWTNLNLNSLKSILIRPMKL